MADPVIRVRGLGHAFGEGEARKPVLFDLDLTVGRGEVVVLTGASGSGKTTLLTLIGCLRAVQSGSAVVLGRELNGAGEAGLVALRRRMGFIFQMHNLHESLTALQNVGMGLEVLGPAAMEEGEGVCAHALALVGLADRLHYLPANLSGGQKQRVAVARALIANPEIVLADEPTAALDRASGRAVVDLLRRLADRRGTTTLMVTHDTRILDVADRVVCMEDGRIARDRSPQGERD